MPDVYIPLYQGQPQQRRDAMICADIDKLLFYTYLYELILRLLKK